MKILVTGSSGFIGRALCRELLAGPAGKVSVAQLNSTNCNLKVETSLNNFNTCAYDMIYHLAAWTKAGDFCLKHSGEQWIVNQQINTNVLAWWQKHQPQAKLICMGTSCSYDPEKDLVEGNYLVGKPIESLFTYAQTKRMLYVGLLALNKQFGLKYLCLVPSTIYGPGYIDKGQSHFIFDLIRKILNGKKHGDPVVLWGDGNQKRELVYIDDFIRITLDLSEQCDNELVNVGAGEEFTIRYFAQLICDQVGYPFEKIKFDSERYVGARSKCLNTEKLKGLIPNLPLTRLGDGLEKTIESFA